MDIVANLSFSSSFYTERPVVADSRNTLGAAALFSHFPKKSFGGAIDVPHFFRHRGGPDFGLIVQPQHVALTRDAVLTTTWKRKGASEKKFFNWPQFHIFVFLADTT